MTGSRQRRRSFDDHTVTSIPASLTARSLGVRDAYAKCPERNEKTADMPNLHGRRTITIDDARKLTGNATAVGLAQGPG